VVLKSQRLTLRDFREDDFEAVHAYATDLEVVRYMSWGPNSEVETREFLDRVHTQAVKDPRMVFELAVVNADSGGLIGGIGLHADGTQAMLGYCFARSAWGQGFATEAASRMARFGFESLGVHRIWAHCDSENAASIRVLEKLGMRREGCLRHECQIRGSWRDTLVFAILEDEWRATHEPGPSPEE
jgi:RimJ/RimL family protein N-acetyltransferase